MLAEKSEKDFPWYVRLVFAYQKRKYGQVLAPMWAWGQQPGLMFVFLFLIGRFRGIDGVSGILRTLMSVRISQLNHCAFCVDFNAHNFLEAHGVATKLEHLAEWRDFLDAYTAEERAALAFSEAVTTNDDPLVADSLAALKGYFDERQIVAITAWIGVQNFSSKFNSALGIPTQGFCRLPPRP